MIQANVTNLRRTNRFEANDFQGERSFALGLNKANNISFALAFTISKPDRHNTKAKLNYSWPIGKYYSSREEKKETTVKQIPYLIIR